MRYPITMVRSFRAAAVLLLVTGMPAFADHIVDCRKESLVDAVAGVKDKDKDLVIAFTGVCAGPIVIRTDGLTLQGVDTAIVDGGGGNAITVAGAGRVTLTGFEVRNGLSGIVAINGAHVSLTGLNVHDNTLFGITLQTGSTGVLTDVTVSDNGFHGLDVQNGSSAMVSGTLSATANRVFGINVNASAINFSRATVTATGNALGIQIATNAGAFLNDANTTINANGNLATGLTVVSGAHLVSFGGTINASGNAGAGVSVNSKAGLDLDAASTLHSFNNGQGLLVQQDSVMTVFNNPQVSQAPGFSTINTHNNSGDGVRVLSGSTLTLVNQARVTSNQNGGFGLIADNGAGLTLRNSTLSANTTKDLQLTFGTRADITTTTIGTVTCDATVLLRGPAFTCPR